jgi:hypothetical protein
VKGIVFNIGELEDWKNRIGEWANRNFPISGYEEESGRSRARMRQALGMMEEYGELRAADTIGDEKETADAVADLMIYSLDLTHTCGFTVSEILALAAPSN